METARQGINKSEGDSAEPALSTICFEDFARIRMHVGTVIAAELNPKARKPAYVLKVDFGGDYGIKTTSAQIVENYKPEELIGRQVIAVLNFPPKNVAGVTSEVLVLAAVCSDEGTVLLSPSGPVTNGSRIL